MQKDISEKSSFIIKSLLYNSIHNVGLARYNQVQPLSSESRHQKKSTMSLEKPNQTPTLNPKFRA